MRGLDTAFPLFVRGFLYLPAGVDKDCRPHSSCEGSPPKPCLQHYATTNVTRRTKPSREISSSLFLMRRHNKGDRCEQRHTAHGLICLDHRRHGPRRNKFRDMLHQAIQSGFSVFDCLTILANDKILSGMLKNKRC